MSRAVLAAILLALGAASSAHGQSSISVFSHTTLPASGRALAECGTVMNDPVTVAEYIQVDTWCGFFRDGVSVDEFSCSPGTPRSECSKLYDTAPGRTYVTSSTHGLEPKFVFPCLSGPAAFYDPLGYGFAIATPVPVPRFTESGTRFGTQQPTCWSLGAPFALWIASTDSNSRVTTSVSPTQVTLNQSQTQRFTANRQVTWSLVQGSGTIDNTGLYQAPASIVEEQTDVIQACDANNGADCARATITLRAATVTVTPVGPEILPAKTQPFSAVASPSSLGNKFTWTRTPEVGSIDVNTGVYTAPPNSELPGPVQITVRACSTTAPSVCGETTATVARMTLTVTGPPTLLVTPGITLTLGANAVGSASSQEVTWAPSAGTVSNPPIGFNTVVYTPPQVTASQTVTIKICLKDSPTTCSDPDYQLVLVPPIVISSAGTWNAGTTGSVTIAGSGFGAAPSVLLGNAAIAFSVVSLSNTSIVLNATVPVAMGGRPLTVTVSSSTSGLTPPAASVTVPSVTRATLTITPSSAQLRETEVRSFTSTCTANNAPCTGLNVPGWVATIGQIDQSGRYTAPALASPATGTVSACWSPFPDHCAVAPITVNPITIVVSPGSPNVNGCSTRQFTAQVTNAPSSTVTWRLTPQIGAIDSNGLYTAPCPVTATAATTVQVQACSTVNSARCGGTPMTLVPVSVAVSPERANVVAGGAFQFAVVVQGTSNTGVNWSIAPAVAAAGTIDANGLYRAPSAITSVTSVTVIATAKADNTTNGTAQITLVTATASLSPTLLSFPAQDIGTTSAAQTVALSNTGTTSFSVSSVAATGDFNVQGHNCSTVAAGTSCTIQVRFAPTAVGLRNGTLQVTDTAPGSPHTASLSGTGRGPLASLAPANLDFGGQRPGFSTSSRTATLSNTGTGTMSISGISVSGEFTVSSNGCGASLGAGASCAIGVKFSPAAASVGERFGTLSVGHNAPGSPHTVSLKGSAYGGFHDASTCHSSSGWAWDPSRPSSPVNVYVYEGSSLLATVAADRYRGDLPGAGIGNGYHAYDWPTPASLRDGQSHTLTIRYSADPGGTPIPGSPKTFVCKLDLFPSGLTPDTVLDTAGTVYTVGTDFSSTKAGQITHLGFYWAPGETGDHVATLRTEGGASLGSVPLFAPAGGSGWTWGQLPDAATIDANTHYRVAVNTNTKQSKSPCSASSSSSLYSPFVNPPLTAHQGYWKAGTGPPDTASCSNFFVNVRFSM